MCVCYIYVLIYDNVTFYIGVAKRFAKVSILHDKFEVNRSCIKITGLISRVERWIYRVKFKAMDNA